MPTPVCALCADAQEVSACAVAPRDETVALCAACRAGVEGAIADDPRWRCLGEAIWSEKPAVQVTAWRLLNRLQGAPWAADLLESAYLEPDVLAWAQSGAEPGGAAPALEHRDSNGALLAAGDTVTLIKDLVVKGGGFTAKRGTAVRGIALDPDNAAHIEGRVNGQRIVLLTEFVKKSG